MHAIAQRRLSRVFIRGKLENREHEFECWSAELQLCLFNFDYASVLIEPSNIFHRVIYAVHRGLTGTKQLKHAE